MSKPKGLSNLLVKLTLASIVIYYLQGLQIPEYFPGYLPHRLPPQLNNSLEKLRQRDEQILEKCSFTPAHLRLMIQIKLFVHNTKKILPFIIHGSYFP